MKESANTTIDSAVAEINLDAVSNNIDIIKSYLPEKTKFCAVLKGDAYGFGLCGMAKHLTELGLIDMIAVGTIREMASALASYSGDCNVLLIGYSMPGEVEELFSDGLIDEKRAVFSGFNMSHLMMLNDIARSKGIRIKIHIRLDNMKTGMGFSYEEFNSCKAVIFSFSNLDICGLYCHFYSSYDENETLLNRQIKRFDELVSSFEERIRERLTVHLLSSGMVFRFPDAAYDMVRIGSAMYGLMEERGLKLGLSVKAGIFAVNRVPESAILGYDSVAREDEKRIIARIMLGSADLFGLLASDKIRVRIGDSFFPLADSPCMDNLCVDVTDAFPPVREFDEAVFVGGEGLSITDILQTSDIDYIHAERICMSTSRLKKNYVGGILCKKD